MAEKRKNSEDSELLDEVMQRKRKRSENWEKSDKELLRRLVAQKIDILENKNVDTNTCIQKRKAWKKILEYFNQVSNTTRTVAQIKCQWRIAKMADRKSLNATRVGSPPKSPSSEVGEFITLIPEDDFNKNEIDCDADNGPDESFLEEVEVPDLKNYYTEELKQAPKINAEPQKKKKNAKYPATISDEMKLELFETAKYANEMEMYFKELEHQKRMEILELELTNLKREDERREKEHNARFNNLTRKASLMKDFAESKLRKCNEKAVPK